MVRVRYFARHREAVGKGEEMYDVGEGSTVGDLLGAVLGRHPELEGMMKDALYAVNRDVVAREERLKEGDEVAFLPPFGGG